MEQLARRAESLEGSNSSLTQKLKAEREELTSRIQQAQFETAEVGLHLNTPHDEPSQSDMHAK